MCDIMEREVMTDVVEAHREELQGLSVAKAAIRFKKLEDLPLDVVRQMLEETKARIDDVEGDRGAKGEPRQSRKGDS
jgi:hypothetical protein